MKKIFWLLIFTVSTQCVKAQFIQQQTHIEAKNLIADSGFILPRIDTLAGLKNRDSLGAMVFRPADSTVYVRRRGKWTPVGFGGAATDTSNISNFSVKVRSLFSGSAPVTYLNGAIGITQSTTSTNGYLSSTDWNTFNGKLSAFGTQTVNTVYAGPASGGSAAPTFRVLTAADIPMLSTYIQNQTSAAQSGGFYTQTGRTSSTMQIGSDITVLGNTLTQNIRSVNGATSAVNLIGGDASNPGGTINLIGGTNASTPGEIQFLTGASTASPSERFRVTVSGASVSGNLSATGSLTTNQGLFVGNGGANTDIPIQLTNTIGSWKLGNNNNGNGTSSNQFYITGAGTEVLTIQKGTGYVGIGTNTPQYGLDVNGIIRSNNAVFSTAINTNTINNNGGLRTNIRSVAVSTTVSATDYTLICTASGITLTMPSAASAYSSTLGGQIYVIENFNTGGSITLSVGYLPKTSATPVTSISSGISIQVQSDGTNWRQIN